MSLLAAQLFGGVLALTGGWAILQTRRTAGKIRRAKVWPSAEGRVTRSVMEKVPGKTAFYRARIEYRYRAVGQDRTGRTVCLGGDIPTTTRARAEALCRRYPEGASPTVYFNPVDPEDACLERCQEGQTVVNLAGALFMIAGLAIVLGILPTG